MKLSILAGSTSQTINIFIQDSSSSTGAGLTGLVYNSASLTAYYGLPKAAAVAITLATQTVTGAYSSGGFVEISSANMPGWYRLDIPDAALASGRYVCLHLKGATNMAPLPIEIELTAWNNQDAVRGGLSALPNAAAAASGGLLISGSNAGTTTLAALTVTGALTVSNGLLVSRSSSGLPAATFTGNGTANGIEITAGSAGNGLNITGGGTGHGVYIASGSGATGNGLYIQAGSTNGNAVALEGVGSGDGLKSTAGATGNALELVGGGTSGNALKATAANGDCFSVTAAGSSKHGMVITGGNAGTSDGLKLVAGTGGVDMRGSITGNLVGTVSTLTTYTGNTLQTGDSFARIGAAGAGLTALGDARIANLDATVSSRMATYTQPSGFLAATFPGGTVASTTNITAGVITTATNVTAVNGLAAGVITAAAVADGAIDAATFASGALDAVWSTAARTLTAFGFTVSTNANATETAIKAVTDALPNAGALTAIQSDLDDVQTRLPAALIGGKMDSTATVTGTVTLADASLTTAKLGAFVLAKTTNITGFNDIAAGAAMTLTSAYDAAKTAGDATAANQTAIRARTDSLTFTVAAQLDVNIQYVNDVQIKGTGAAGDTWGPV